MGGGWGSLPVGWLLLPLSPFGFKQICLFVEVWLAVGSSAGEAAAFNCPLLWRGGAGEVVRGGLEGRGGGRQLRSPHNGGYGPATHTEGTRIHMDARVHLCGRGLLCTFDARCDQYGQVRGRSTRVFQTYVSVKTSSVHSLFFFPRL